MFEEEFFATGKTNPTSGFPRAAFSTTIPNGFESGVIVQGARCGVVGEGLQAEFPKEGSPGSSSYPGVGVEGHGVNFGTVGRGSRKALAGVFGDATKCQVGVLGAVMDPKGEDRAGIGVFGAAIRSMGNPLSTFNPIPGRVDGLGTGVLGMSGLGPGVRGRSIEGSGGDFDSIEGPGVSSESSSGSGVRGGSEQGAGGEFFSSNGPGVQAISEGNRGGVFQSGENIAQIGLVPMFQLGRKPELPQSGDAGDLLLIRNVIELEGKVISDRCSLWLCVPAPGGFSLNAFWQEVQLGKPVRGTL